MLQVEAEVTSFLKMLDEVYAIFGLEYSMALSTRPEGYLGEVPLWDQAEAALTDALKKTGYLCLSKSIVCSMFCKCHNVCKCTYCS